MVEPDATPAPDLDPLAGGSEATRRSIWPAIYPELLEAGRRPTSSTILFVNNRRSAERLALRLNDLAEREIARAHHGSLAREERTVVEEMLKAGELPCLVATSSLELGIDMGAVDLVIQVESPKSVARGLQRIGRAGHSVGDVSRGRIFPKFRADLLECAVVARRMREGEIETTVVPRNALDVLAQQIVAIAAAAPDDEPVAVDELYALVTRHALLRRAEPHTRSRTCSTCSTAATRHRSSPSCARGSCGTGSRARSGPRPGARQLAVTNAGTIPDRGLYAVTLPDGRRVGELDEEMVYEARPGQTFLLGATHVADRGDRPRPGDRDPGARAARSGPVLEGRRHRPPEGAGRGDRRVRPLGGRPGRPRRSSATTTSTAAPPATSSSSCRGAAGRHAGGAVGPRDRGGALPRRDRRLAAVRAVSRSAAASTPPGRWR